MYCESVFEGADNSGRARSPGGGGLAGLFDVRAGRRGGGADRDGRRRRHVSVCLLFVEKLQSPKSPLTYKSQAQELVIERMWPCSDKNWIWARRTGKNANIKSAI